MNTGLVGLAKSIALPGEHAPVRFPSFPALERTAVMGFSTPVTGSVSTTVTKALVMRQATYPMWFDQTFSGSWTYWITTKTEALQANVANLIDLTLKVVPQVIYAGQGATTPTDFTQVAVPVDTATLLANGPFLGVDHETGPQPWVYVPAGCTFSVCVSHNDAGIATPIKVAFTYDAWQEPGAYSSFPWQLAQIDASKSGGFAAITASSTGQWYRVSSITVNSSTTFPNLLNFSVHCFVSNYVPTYVPSATTAGTLVYNAPVATTNMLLPIASPPEFANSSLPYESTRTTAVGALFTNVTKALNKEGTVMWGRLAPQTINVWRAGLTNVTGLHPSEKAYLPLETGAYTYVPPSTDMAVFWDYTIPIGVYPSPTGTRFPIIRLDNTSLVNAGFFSDPDGGTNLAITADWHFEFRTTSALFSIGLSGTTLESFHQAQLSLVEAGFFFANETHKSILSKIIGFANRAVKLMAPNQYAVLKAGYRTVRSLIAPPPPRRSKRKQGKRKVRNSRPSNIRPRAGPQHPPPTSLNTRVKKPGGLDMFLAKNPQYNRRK